MSPTENDLRAALRQTDDGTAPDADRIVRRAREQRAHRRKRIASVAAVVVVVGGAVTGVTFAVRGAGESSGSGMVAGPAMGVHQGPAPSSAGDRTTEAGPDIGAMAPAGTARCPAGSPTVPRTGRSDGPLFARTPVAVLVCSYGVDIASLAGHPHPSPVRSSAYLTGRVAAELVDSLEHASTSPPHVLCPQYVTLQAQTLFIYGVDAQGRSLPVVVTSTGRPACQVTVTNGTTTRYDWAVPAALIGKLGLRSVGGVQPSR